MTEHRRRGLAATGLFLALLGVYLLTAPGRIDIIDGQWRYEVAKNWLERGQPFVTDPYLTPNPLCPVNPRTGRHYAFYNAAPSLTPMPLMALAHRLPGHSSESDRFAFSLAGPLFGALLGALLVLGYGFLGIPVRHSLGCAAVFCLATLWWPASVTTFDQNQHAVFLLVTVLLAWRSGRHQSLGLAALAGLVGGLLLNFQETYALALPLAGVAVLAAPQEGQSESALACTCKPNRAALRRYLTFGLCCGVGLALFLAFNQIRFGTLLAPDRYGMSHPELTRFRPPTWGNPLAGFLGLAISPGKGCFWFSPPLALVLLGARGLWKRAPALALTVVGVTFAYLLLIVQLTFFGGDWCWGPRYLIPVMPLWALAFPFAAPRLPHPRRRIPGAGCPHPASLGTGFGYRRSGWMAWCAPLVVAGLFVQMMAVSLDYQRFFYERDLPTCFWAFDPWFYFRNSQLLARPLEIARTIREGLPPEAIYFSPAPGQATYTPLGFPNPYHADRSMRQYQIFYLPRPWWGWIGHVRPANRPVEPRFLWAWCASLLLTGALLIQQTLRVGPRTNDASEAESLLPPLPALGEGARG